MADKTHDETDTRDDVTVAENEAEILKPALEDKTMTFAEQLRREGMQQGKLEGEQIMLMKLLHRRFPSDQSTYEDRIKNARAEELLSWGERILDAKSIDEVF